MKTGVVKQASLKAEIEYAVVALELSAHELAAIIRDVAGASVDANATNFLQGLDRSQLEAVKEKLLDDPRWKKASKAAS